MRNRSRIHMLRVLAMNFEGNAPEALTKAVRGYARELEARASDGRRNDFVQENARIEEQRRIFALLPDTPEVELLKEGMMQRAYDLMWEGFALETDAILEFLPSECADEVLNAWDNDEQGKEPRSRFH